MSPKDERPFNDLAAAVRAATDQYQQVAASGDEGAAEAAQRELIGILTDGVIAVAEAVGRFSPLTNPGFFSDQPSDFTEVVLAGLDLDPEARVGREYVGALAQVDERHRDNPVMRELALAMGGSHLAVRAVLTLEQEVIALRRELRGS